MNGCLKAVIIGFAVLIVLGGITAVILAFAIGSAVHHVSSSIDADSKTAAATCAGVSYPGHESLDHCADANAEVRDAGLTVTARNLRRVTGGQLPFTGPTSSTDTGSSIAPSSELCADVTMHNRASSTKPYSQFVWQLRPPGGGTQGVSLGTSGTLGSGTIPPGGDVRGSVCFADPGVTGQYVLVWHPLALTADQGIWLFQVS